MDAGQFLVLGRIGSLVPSTLLPSVISDFSSSGLWIRWLMIMSSIARYLEVDSMPWVGSHCVN
jgi:hypothetical protein